MKNTVRAVLVAVLAIPALAFGQVPAAPQVPSTAAVKDAGNAAAASGQAATDSAKAQTKSTGQQVKDTAKTEGKKGAKTGVDEGVKKTGTVGAAAAPHAHGAAATGVDKGVDTAADKVGIK
jgi:hypothetical protein